MENTAEEWINPFTKQYDTSVNNIQRCIKNPIAHLQKEIDKKNKKYPSYIKNCDECSLLIIIPDCREGCFCQFDKLSNFKFKTKFNSIFLYNSDSHNLIHQERNSLFKL